MSSTGARNRRTIDTRVIDGLIKNEEQFIQSLKVFGNNSSAGVNPGEGSGGSIPTANQASNTKIKELADISGNFQIDFATMDDRSLVANVTGNLTITFTNIPTILRMNIRLYIRSTNPTITIGGTIVSGAGSNPLITTAIDDFLDISLGSIDQSTILIFSTKKNDESETAPSIPLNVVSSGHTNNSVDISWDPPAVGSLPLLYDVEYSLSSAETNGVPDSPITDPSTKNLTTDFVTVNSLLAGTTYYFWVRAKNDVGNSDYIGPLQTNTDGSYTAGDVNFTLAALDFNTIRASYTQPTGKQLKFTLKRNLGGGITETVVDNDVPASGITHTYDDDFLEPNTLYNYIFEVRNEFGSLISTINANATTPNLPAPTVVFENVGVKLQFTVTLPAGINLAEIEWATASTVDGNGSFTVQKVSRTISRPIGGGIGQINVVFLSNVLTKSTTYYGHARLQKNDLTGPFSATASDVTSNVLPPSTPGNIITSPSTGAARFKMTFNDAQSTGEWIEVAQRPGGSITPFIPYKSYFRDDPPISDLDPLENKIEVIETGFTPGSQIEFRSSAVNQSGFNGVADFDTVNIDL